MIWPISNCCLGLSVYIFIHRKSFDLILLESQEGVDWNSSFFSHISPLLCPLVPPLYDLLQRSLTRSPVLWPGSCSVGKRMADFICFFSPLNGVLRLCPDASSVSPSWCMEGGSERVFFFCFVLISGPQSLYQWRDEASKRKRDTDVWFWCCGTKAAQLNWCGSETARWVSSECSYLGRIFYGDKSLKKDSVGQDLYLQYPSQMPHLCGGVWECAGP